MACSELLKLFFFILATVTPFVIFGFVRTPYVIFKRTEHLGASWQTLSEKFLSP